MKDKKYLAIGLVIILVLSLGCVENTTQPKPIKESAPKVPINDSAPIYTVSPTVSVPVDEPIRVIQDNDKKFLEWIRSSMTILDTDIRNVSDAASSSDLKLVGTHGKKLKDDSKIYLDQIDKFSVSSDFKEIFDEYKAALEDLYLAGKYEEQGAKNVGSNDSNDIETAKDYMKKAGEHIDMATSLAKSKTSEK